MSILATLLGEENPVAQWAGRNSNMLTGLSASLLSSGMNFAPMQRGSMLDTEAAQQKEAEAKAAQSDNMTSAWIKQAYPEYAHLPVEQGFRLAQAAEAARRSGAGDNMTANMRDWQFAQENPGYLEFLKGGSGGGNMPASLQEYEYAKAQGFNGSLLDYEKQKKAAGRAAMSPTAQKELFEAEDAANSGNYVLSALDEAVALNDKAYDGPMADVRGDTTALFGDESGVATARMKNLTTELALSQLKTIFGAMPTEGERKILLELQGSVNQPKQVRAAIFKRAREMAARRIADNKAKADALRSGAYFEPGYGAAPGGNADVDAILQQYGVP